MRRPLRAVAAVFLWIPLSLSTALAGAEPEAVESPLERAGRLARTGGCRSLPQLRDLLRHEEVAVRTAALRAAQRIGLRQATLSSGIREAAADPAVEVRVAAIEAMGAVGSGADVSVLLAALEDEDGRIRSAAFDAIQRLSGTKMTPSARRWRAWWGKAQSQGLQALERGLDAVEAGEPACATAARARRDAMLRWGCIDPRRVTARVETWLESDDPELQEEALHLVAGLRLGETERAVRRALPTAARQHAELARDVAALLGIPVEAVAETAAR
jgi:HEAT repeat protein